MVFRLQYGNSSKSAPPYFYIGGFVAVYLFKMAATMGGPTSIPVRFKQRLVYLLNRNCVFLTCSEALHFAI